MTTSRPIQSRPFSGKFLFFICFALTICFSGKVQEVAARITITRGTEPLPQSVDNRDTPYFPPILSQAGNSCANAASIGYVFNYEINALRNRPVAEPANAYPFYNTYNFLNEGSTEGGTYLMYLDAWGFVRDNGIISLEDFGRQDSRATKWITGYDKYHRGMSNRVTAIDSLSFSDEGTLELLKQWLFDHGNGSPNGGMFLFLVSYAQIQTATLTEGSNTGKHVMRYFGRNPDFGLHDLSVVGYDDGIRYDFNNDGSVTDDKDINNDGKVDLADSETGAFIVANSWGSDHLDGGCFYAPYRLFVTPRSDGGVFSDKAYFIGVAEEYSTERTFKITLSHGTRNALGLSVGVSADSSATEPSAVRKINQFDHAGGAHPMQGYGADATLEFGLDVSDLKDSLSGNKPAAYYLIIDADDNNGTCEALSLMDYTSDPPVEHAVSGTPRQLRQGETIFRIPVPASTGSNRMVARRKRMLHPSITVRNSRIHLTALPDEASAIVYLYGADGTLLLQRNLSGSSCVLVTPPLAAGVYFLRIFNMKTERYSGTVTVVP